MKEKTSKIFGKHVYPDGTQYSGEWNEEGLRHGLGRLITPSLKGWNYTGEFMNGLPNGLGVVTTPHFRYEGYFSKGIMHGVGKLKRSDGLHYSGEFKNGKIEGMGAMQFPEGGNGLPTNEGEFDGTKMISRKPTEDIVNKANEAAIKARNLAVE